MGKAARAALVLLLLLAAAGSAAVPTVGVAQRQSPSLELGYGRGSLAPVSDGVPVYTQGDELWALSDYNHTIAAQLAGPDGSLPVTNLRLAPEAPVRVYTFTDDPTGVWSLDMAIGNASFSSVSFLLEPSVVPSPVQFVGSHLTSAGNVSINMQFSLGDAYNSMGCVVGQAVPHTVLIPFPSDLGQGSVALNYGAGLVTAESIPSKPAYPRGPFEFWAELYYPYTYVSLETPLQSVSRDALAAATQPVTFPAGGASNFTVPLTNSVELRQGRFVVRAFFRDSKGLFVSETSILRYGDSWVWAGGCSARAQLASSTTFSASMLLPPNRWPRGLFADFMVAGVETVVWRPLDLNLSAVSLIGKLPSGSVPAYASLPRYVTVNVTAGPGVSEAVVGNGTVFLDLRSLPASATFTVGYGGSGAQNSTLRFSSPDGKSVLNVSLGALFVNVTQGGTPAGGAAVTAALSGSPGTAIASSKADSRGEASLLLLAGQYTVAATYAGQHGSAEVQVDAGQVVHVQLPVPGPAPATATYALAALTCVGVGLNLWVWRVSLARVARRLRDSLQPRGTQAD